MDSPLLCIVRPSVLVWVHCPLSHNLGIRLGYLLTASCACIAIFQTSILKHTVQICLLGKYMDEIPLKAKSPSPSPMTWVGTLPRTYKPRSLWRPRYRHPSAIYTRDFCWQRIRVENHLVALEMGLGWPMRAQEQGMGQRLDQGLPIHRPAGMAGYGPIQPSAAV